MNIFSAIYYAYRKLFKKGETPETEGEEQEESDEVREVKRGKIKSFEKVTLHTSGMRFVLDDEIVMKDGKAAVTRYSVRYDGHEDVRTPEESAECSEEEVLKILNDCKMLSWNGFHGAHPRGVLDGTMFRLEATVNGGETIRAEGSQNFPKHYHDFTDWIYATLRRAEEKKD
ncbi:MAG: hypothetical protein IK047_06530 [Clostridia bacterium]|nr:hypothetical protein [Clostridia bacterium]